MEHLCNVSTVILPAVINMRIQVNESVVFTCHYNFLSMKYIKSRLSSHLKLTLEKARSAKLLECKISFVYDLS